MPPPTAKPLSERALQRYINSKKLLSLPDDILCQIASHLIPLPPSNPPTITTLKHALSLSQTCQRLHAIVISRLSTLDFLTPSSYTNRTCRTPRHASRQLENFVKAAAPHLQRLCLPQGYGATDGVYTAVAECVNLRHLSLPIRSPLNVTEAQNFFSTFSNLESVMLDLPSTSFVLGLCYAPACLKEVTFTKYPAEPQWFTSLSALLIGKGVNLAKLDINLLCEDTKTLYKTAQPDSLLHTEQLLEPNHALARLSGLLTRRVEVDGLPALRELGVSTIPDIPTDDPHRSYNVPAATSIIRQIDRAIQTARQNNPRPKGLKKLRIKFKPESINVGIAFMSNWIDREVEVEVSFNDNTILFHPNCPDGQIAKPKMKGMMLWFHPNSSCRVLPGVDFEVETIRIGNDYSMIRFNPLSSALISFRHAAHGKRVKTLKMTYDLPSVTVLEDMTTLLGEVAHFIPKLTTLELPADVVLFYACSEGNMSLVEKSRYSIKALRLYEFRDSEVILLDKAHAMWRFPVEHASVAGIKQKVRWFLKGLPTFLRMLKKDFPKLEVLYMEQICVYPGVVDDKDLFRAMQAVEWYEKACGVDASTLMTEIMHWRKRRLVGTNDELRPDVHKRD